MSYLIDVEDVKSSDLRRELLRRDKMVAEKKCPYCEQELASRHVCRYAGREADYHDVNARGKAVKYPIS